MMFLCRHSSILITCFLFFVTDTATTEIYTLSLHDALPIFSGTLTPPARDRIANFNHANRALGIGPIEVIEKDRKSTRLNSSHTVISYAVFCLKKKKKEKNTQHHQT